MANIYMKVDGVQGNVTVKNYEGWIELMDVSFGVSKQVAMKIGGMKDRTNGLLHFQEVQIRKMLDSSSCSLFGKSLHDRATAKVELHLVDIEKNHVHYKMILNDVLFSDYQSHIFQNTLPIEFIKLSYTQLAQTYIGKDQFGKAQVPISVGYNLIKAESV